MHVVIHENDINFVKRSFESNFSAKTKFDHEIVASVDDNINF